jgi:hypothetical protein
MVPFSMGIIIPLIESTRQYTVQSRPDRGGIALA